MISFPNAKINIGLNVVRKREDGYHDIETVMVPVGWSDILEIVPSKIPDETKLNVSGRKVDCPAEKNLVFKALREVEKMVGRALPVDIFLRKILPDGAGLGGGSADGAFMIKSLNDEFSLGLTVKDMENIASKIGSDCPVFIRNVPMLATGRGEILEAVHLPLRNWKIIIVKPKESVSTAQAYNGIVPKQPEVPLKSLIQLPVSEWKNSIYNDFENVVFKIYPSFKKIKNTLYDRGAVYSSMSGSGSAFYGLFEPDSDKLADIVHYFGRKGMTVKLTDIKI